MNPCPQVIKPCLLVCTGCQKVCNILGEDEDASILDTPDSPQRKDAVAQIQERGGQKHQGFCQTPHQMQCLIAFGAGNLLEGEDIQRIEIEAALSIDDSQTLPKPAFQSAVLVQIALCLFTLQ
ncbi:hypothetical protein DSECCO2_584400 [anaerobic digester metagenome]